MKIDLHNHTVLCNHSKDTEEDFIQRAIELGINIFGFSDHSYMNFDQKYRMKFDEIKLYEKKIALLKDKYSDKIEILIGYEVDYFKTLLEERVLKADVDYLIGSVHFLDKWGFDNPEFIREYKARDIDRVWEEYFKAIENLAKSGHFDIVGHLDLIKVFKFLPKKEIKTIAKDAIKAIKKANLVVEINSAGFRKPIAEQYPSLELLELIFESGIDITFGSDAHSKEQVGLNLDKSIEIAKNIGFKEAVVFRKRDRAYLNIN